MKVVVLLSGGIDSTVLLANLAEEGHDIFPISFDYGQRHDQEIRGARNVIGHYGLLDNWEVAEVRDLRKLTQGVSSQTDMAIPVPKGHYSDKSMSVTVVPNRNMIMLSLAAAKADTLAQLTKSEVLLAYAAHAGDHPIYPDCRPEFADVMGDAVKLATDERVRLITPFITLKKEYIVAVGESLHVPFHLTFSCYEGCYPVHCGTCGTCVERKEAFDLASVKDPTKYKE